MGSAPTKSTGRTTPKGTRPKQRANGNGNANLNTLDHLRSKKGIVKRVPIYLDSEVQERFEEAVQAYARLDLKSYRDSLTDEAIKRIQQELIDATEELKQNTVMLTIRRPVCDDDDGRTLKGRRAYEWLLEQHPPTDDDVAEYRKSFPDDPDGQPLYNGDTFPDALISACLEEPAATPDEVAELTADWSQTEVLQIFNTCMECCHGTQVASLGKGFGVTNASSRN